MPYTAQTWTNNDPTTPLSAARMTTIENGIVAASKFASSSFKQTTAAASPSATLNVNGSAVTITRDATFAGIAPLALFVTTAGVSGETITATVTFTFDDATTATWVPTATTNVATNAADNNLFGAFKDAHYMTGVSMVIKSSINSSVATATLSLAGLNIT